MTALEEAGRLCRAAAHEVAIMSRRDKDAALYAMSHALRNDSETILNANRLDCQRAYEASMSEAMIDRLRLDKDRIEQIAYACESIADLPDPIGRIVEGWISQEGVKIERVVTPLGVIGMIYEARPNVTVDAAAIALKTGNAVILKGSSSAEESNKAIVTSLKRGLADIGYPHESIQFLEGGHEVTTQMMGAVGLIDVLIPRGGAKLISTVVESARIPVIETGTGNCHLYIDLHADMEMARKIILNAKTQRPSVCNALETILIHKDRLDQIGLLIDDLVRAGVKVHGDERAHACDQRIIPARPDEFEAEYLSLDVAIAVVDSCAEAVDHIRRYGSGHSETIITSDIASEKYFTDHVDAAAVLVNTSSRFVDGGEFGFGAEIGISTQKLHARGPMGLEQMTSYKYILRGQGQVRS